MKVTNYQLKLIIPILINAAREKPDVELDAVIDRLVEMARYRGMTMTRIAGGADPNDMQGVALRAEVERPERATTTGKVGISTPAQKDSRSAVHPLFRDPEKKAARRKTA